jgi:hypothetical protein
MIDGIVAGRLHGAPSARAPKTGASDPPYQPEAARYEGASAGPSAAPH